MLAGGKRLKELAAVSIWKIRKSRNDGSFSGKYWEAYDIPVKL